MSRADWTELALARQPELDMGQEARPVDGREDPVKRMTMAVLRRHPDVTWWGRMQAGSVKLANGAWMQLCPKGTADFLALVLVKGRGHPAWLETKGEKTPVTPEQVAFIEARRKEGHYAGVVRTRADVLAVLAGKRV